MNLRELFKKAADKDSVLQAAIAEVKEQPIRSFFKSDLFKTIIHQSCKIIIAIRDAYLQGQNISEDEFEKAITEYLDNAIALPIWAEPFDGLIIGYGIKLVFDLIEKQAAEEIETLKTAMLADPDFEAAMA